jgi:ubiquinone/menaquinone biosynthesis C-methylase UbiE
VILLVVAALDLVQQALAEAGEDDEVIVVDESPARLEAVERELRDPRVWYLIGSPDILPLPDRFVDRALGIEGEDLSRVLR